MEGVDALLGIADGEHGARSLARADAGEELILQRRDQIPLRGAGVLAFVDQDVIEAAVELVEHPGRGFGALQQRLRVFDQIVEIERAGARAWRRS